MTSAANRLPDFSYRRALHCAGLLVALLLTGTSAASQKAPIDPDADVSANISTLQKHWATVQYQLDEKATRVREMAELAQLAQTVRQRFPGRAEPLIWEGIIVSSQAAINGGLGALKLVRRARELFELALDIDEAALNGSAHVSLGSLYYMVPSWPLAFGNHDKADTHLRRALQIDPDSIDANFFYAGLLEKRGDISGAITTLQKAAAAPARPERPVADRGRREEIARQLDRLRKR